MKNRIPEVRSRFLACATGCLMVGLLFALPASGLAQEADQSERIRLGAQAYGRMCGRCHNPRSPIERNDREWVMIMAHMRSRGNLTGSQVRQIVAFLQAMNSDPRRPTRLVSTLGDTTGDVMEDLDAPIRNELATRGGELFREKACIGCHAIDGDGGDVGPKLDRVADRRDLPFIRQKLLDPTFNNATSMMPNLGLTREEVEALVAFLAGPEE